MWHFKYIQKIIIDHFFSFSSSSNMASHWHIVTEIPDIWFFMDVKIGNTEIITARSLTLSVCLSLARTHTQISNKLHLFSFKS